MIPIALLAVLSIQTSAPPAVEAGTAFAVVATESGIELRRYDLVEGEPLLLATGAGGAVVEVILPPGPGGSGSLAQASARGTAELLLRNGAVHATFRTDAGGEWQRPPVTLAELRGLAVRVSVTDAGGRGRAFTISGWDEALSDPIGPVVDPFRGLVPMQPGDHVIFTDSLRLVTGPAAAGGAPLIHDRYVFVEGRTPGGGRGLFVLDTGGAETAVDRSFLPADTSIAPASVSEYSAAGKRSLDYSPSGATGEVHGVLGHALLDELVFGEIHFAQVPVAVFDEIPQLFGREVAGILGLDLLDERDRLHRRRVP